MPVLNLSFEYFVQWRLAEIKTLRFTELTSVF